MFDDQPMSSSPKPVVYQHHREGQVHTQMEAQKAQVSYLEPCSKGFRCLFDWGKGYDCPRAESHVIYSSAAKKQRRTMGRLCFLAGNTASAPHLRIAI